MRNSNDLEHVNSLQELFELWKKAHAEEINSLISDQWDENKNTIPSHFMQFIIKYEPLKWRYILSSAFNMDGCVGDPTESEGNYKQIILLKEANDSAKTDANNYSENENICNKWLVDWKKDKATGNVSMLNKLCKACTGKNCTDDKNRSEFIDTVAYMNINKRGGGSHAEDQIIINYAKKYKDYIKREIYLLADENATVYVGGSKDYFRDLMNALEITIEPSEKSSRPIAFVNLKDKGNIKFIQITHPSSWGISWKKLQKQMLNN